MNNEEFWSSVYSGNSESKRPVRLSLIRLALLFGVAAGTMALVVPRMLHETGSWRTAARHSGIDYTTTSTIRKVHEYTVRRSVLQPGSEGVCILDSLGGQSGGC